MVFRIYRLGVGTSRGPPSVATPNKKGSRGINYAGVRGKRDAGQQWNQGQGQEERRNTVKGVVYRRPVAAAALVKYTRFPAQSIVTLGRVQDSHPHEQLLIRSLPALFFAGEFHHLNANPLGSARIIIPES